MFETLVNRPLLEKDGPGFGEKGRVDNWEEFGLAVPDFLVVLFVLMPQLVGHFAAESSLLAVLVDIPAPLKLGDGLAHLIPQSVPKLFPSVLHKLVPQRPHKTLGQFPPQLVYLLRVYM